MKNIKDIPFRLIIGLTLFIIIALLATSCSKEPKNHSIKFEVSFTEEPNNGNSNGIEVTCNPHYSDETPIIAKSIIKPGYLWTYEYAELKNMDDVLFVVNSQLSYIFEMKIYIDNKLISSRKIITSDNTYYSTITESQTGINNSRDENYPIIEFQYHE